MTCRAKYNQQLATESKWIPHT